tara:strand:+ start:90 stop:320 length:231 start_codon:yes stop_codon:yes gene_type:complete
MKRLLLAPLLIALAGCSSDIVVKTDLGEKYIVKKSALIAIPKGEDELLDEIWNRCRFNQYIRCSRFGSRGISRDLR